MGVDCKIYLPGNVRVRDVANVMGIAAGLKPSWHKKGWAEVPGVALKPTSLVEMCSIELSGELVDKSDKHFCGYHFEGGRGASRLLSPRSTAFWIGVGRRLVNFFGGEMTYQDCDDGIDFFLPPKSDAENKPEDGDEWDVFQKRVVAVVPLTLEELQGLNELAAYKETFVIQTL